MVENVIQQKWLTAKGVVGFFPANSVGHDDVEIYTDGSRRHVRAKLHFLRQQMAKGSKRANLCLADFVAPKESGVADYIGAFAVTAGLGIEAKLAEFKKDLDDYADILLKALADRLAEAFAERLHERVRRELWAYAGDEELDNEALVKERYQGIRPAPGYPACPDHTEKATLFKLLEAEDNAAIELTESFAMMPAASVSGFYFLAPGQPLLRHWQDRQGPGPDYARRKGLPLAEAEKWLAPSLGYKR